MADEVGERTLVHEPPALHVPIDRRDPWNFAKLAAHQALMRIGWIFKTESVIMPLVLDTLGASAWMRGALPMLNRLGQSIPPVLAAPWIARRARTKFAVCGASGLMAAVFFCLAVVWLRPPTASDRATWGFLGMYLAFFIGVGLHQLAYSSLTAKLVIAPRRGRLLLHANVWGGLGAISCAWLVIRPLLAGGTAGFAWIFLFAGLLFAMAAYGVLTVREPAQSFAVGARRRATPLRDMAAALARDKNLRRLVAVSVMFGLSYALFPHYQSLGRARLKLALVDLVPWMIAQNVGVTLFSLPVGWIADRWGNRLALILLMAGSMAAPLLAIAITAGSGLGHGPYWLVFLLLGMMPLTMRVATNLALELAEPSQQPLYVSVANLALSLPVVGLSLLIGWCIDLMGFEVCFLIVAGGLLVGFPLVWRLKEPRFRDVTQENWPRGDQLSAGSGD